MLRKFSAKAMFIAALALPALTTFAAEAENAAHAVAEPKGELLEWNPLALVWTLAIFIVVAFILYRAAWKNVLAGLKGREAKIRGDIAQAEAARAKSEATLKDYSTQLATAEHRVREILSKATTDAEQLATTIRSRAQQEAEEIKDRATKEINAAREQALTDIYAQTADLATKVAEKILRRNLNADDQRDLVNQSLSELQSASAN